MEVFRVKEFHFKPSQSTEPVDDDQTDEAAVTQRDNDQEILAGSPAKKSQGNGSKSTWNVDGEPVEEPGVHVRWVYILLAREVGKIVG